MNTYRRAKKDVKMSIEQLKCTCSSHKAIMKLQKTCTSPLLCYFPIHFEAWQLQFPVITRKSDQHNSLKLLHLLLLLHERQISAKRFGTTWRWANDIIFIFGWTIHLHTVYVCAVPAIKITSYACVPEEVQYITVTLCLTSVCVYALQCTCSIGEVLRNYMSTPWHPQMIERERERKSALSRDVHMYWSVNTE